MTRSPLRVLWTSNIVLPAVAEELGLTRTPYGGWLSLMTERLGARADFEIGVAMRAEVTSLRRIDKGGITYFSLPRRKTNRHDVRQEDCESVLSQFAPDILHVEGAEMRHARRFLATWPGPRLVSVQGILNGIAPYELGRLPVLRMLNPLHPRVAVTAVALLASRSLRFLPRLAHERAAMAMATHVMGRTLWDEAQSAALNPRARYYSCPRLLREPFYRTRWQGRDCEPFSLFVGNSAVPLKGTHFALAAVARLREEFPDVRLYVAGEDPSRLAFGRLKRHIGYPVYLQHLIAKLGLQDRVAFTGVLDAEEMAARMAQSNVYLMSSVIENSPNTLGEAMLVGVPTVSAYAGGAPSMAADEREALFYRADDPAMLAHQVRRIFLDDELATGLSQAARARAQATHDPECNLESLVAAYEVIRNEAT